MESKLQLLSIYFPGTGPSFQAYFWYDLALIWPLISGHSHYFQRYHCSYDNHVFPCTYLITSYSLLCALGLQQRTQQASPPSPHSRAKILVDAAIGPKKKHKNQSNVCLMQLCNLQETEKRRKWPGAKMERGAFRWLVIRHLSSATHNSINSYYDSLSFLHFFD